MSQTATRLVKDVLERTATDSQTGTAERSTLTRSELEAAVRDGVREGIVEYQRENDERMDLRPAERDASDGDGSSGGGLGRLLVLGLVVAGILYRRRRRAGRDDSSSEF